MDQLKLQRSHWLRKSLVFACIVIAAAGYAYWRSGAPSRTETQQSAAQPAGVPVTIMSASPTHFDVQLEGLGSVQPINTVVVRSRVDGQIEQIQFKEGQVVQQGDLLLKIDQRPFRAALQQAQAKLAQDQANLKNANLDLQRYSALAQKAFASRQQLDTQQAAVSSGTALTQADQAAVDSAQIQLDYTEIRAPSAGRIGFRQVDAGNIVHASDAQGLLSIVEMNPINVLYTLPEGSLSAVQQAMSRGRVPVIATAVGQTNQAQAQGSISVVNNQVDKTSGTVQIKAVFNNDDMKLWPGQSVTTRTLVKTLDNVIVVPADAVQHGPDGLFVWRIDAQNIASVAKVAVNDQDTANAVIADGLNAGDRYVLNGQLRLKPGIKVDPHEAPAANARAGVASVNIQ